MCHVSVCILALHHYESSILQYNLLCRFKIQLIDYKIMKDSRNSYYIHGNTSFPSIRLLLQYYRDTYINDVKKIRLLHPVSRKEMLVKDYFSGVRLILFWRSYSVADSIQFLSSITPSLVPRLSNYCGGGKENLVSIAYACANCPRIL